MVTVPRDPYHVRCGRVSISSDFASEHRGLLLAERSVRSDVVVMRSPAIDGRARALEARDQFRSRQYSLNFALKLSTNAFCVGLPDWMKCNLTPARRDQKNIALQVSSGPLSDYALRQRPSEGKPIQLVRQALPGDREVGELQNALPCVVIHDVEHSEAPAVRELIGDEIDGPAFVDRVRQEHGDPRSIELFAPFRAHLQPSR